MQKIYLEKSTEELNKLENLYDVLPQQPSRDAAIKSLNQMCYARTHAIAQAHHKKLITQNLEKDLTSYRHYAVKKLWS